MKFITELLQIIRNIASFVLPFFIFLIVFNAGNSEKPQTLFKTIREEWKFFLRLIVFNNLFVPLAVWLILQAIPIAPPFENGLLILFLSAGAPTIIMFVSTANEDTKYATTAMVLLTFTTVIFLPILLPLLVTGAEITMGDLVGNLITSILIPLVIGSLVRIFFENFTVKMRPYLKKLQQVLMNIAIYGLIIGYIPQVIEIIGSGMIVTGLSFVLLGFGAGYVLEKKNENRAIQLTSGFAAGQRNASVAFSVAINNFSSPEIFLTIAIISTVATAILNNLAMYMNKRQADTQSSR